MVRNKLTILTLFVLSAILLTGPSVAGAENEVSVDSSEPSISERQAFSSAAISSDSIEGVAAQGSIKWKQGWNSVDGKWFYADSTNPVALRSGWLNAGGSWYWLDPEADGAMATGLHVCNDAAYWFNASGAMATG